MPLVELRTTHNVVFVTDNAGVIAVDEPELMDREDFFPVEGHGCEVPKDGFGIRLRRCGYGKVTLEMHSNATYDIVHI